MMKGKKIISTTTICFVLFLLIMDAKTALNGAKEGLTMCIAVVIPSLFPFLVISALLPGRFMGRKIPAFGILNRVCGIPKGAESLLILGFLSGYPAGATMIADAYQHGRLTKSSANRLMGFCSNAGPAFLFGMVGALFPQKSSVWLLWLIHIITALLVGAVLPQSEDYSCRLRKKAPTTLPQALEKAIKTMANICGWVIIFRIILTILNRWVLWLLPKEAQACIWGIMELSNGITYLHNLDGSGIRFVLSSAFLAFGGLCVGMQTVSVTKDLGLGQYFPGKVLHCLFSILIASVVQYGLFSPEACVHFPYIFYIALTFGIILIIFLLQKKKSSSISEASVV